MDTTRIIINQVDSSSVSLAEDTTVTGFTVVKAPKGPISPVYIPAASTAKLKDIFGTATSDYPDLFEVSSYNSEYGVYVSAPYTKAGVPFAVVTGEGICKADCLIEYTPEVEAYVAGRTNEIPNMNFLNMDGTPIASEGYHRLFDTRYAKSYGLSSRAVNVGGMKVEGHQYLGYSATGDSAQVFLCTGLPAKDAAVIEDKKLILDNLPGLDGAKVKLRFQNIVFEAKYTYKGVLVAEKKTDSTYIYTYLTDTEFKGADYSDSNKYTVFHLNDSSASREGLVYTFSQTGEDIGTFREAEINALRAVAAFNASHLPEKDLKALLLEKYERFGTAVRTDVYTNYTADIVDDEYNRFVGTLVAEENHYAGDTDKETYLRVNISGVQSSHVNLENSSLLTSEYIRVYLGSQENRRAVKTYWEYTDSENPFKSSAVKALIFPKYPSTGRTLHLTFAGEDRLQDYDFSTLTGRNMLTISAYEDDAFHGSSAQAITVTGSLDDQYKNAYGAYIGFTPSHSAYASQELFVVYVKNKFTSLSELNLNVTDYAPIDLDGGIREFGNDEDALYNLGWEQGKDPELRADIFFNPRCYSEMPNNVTDHFFKLASDNQFAGFIFNYTPAVDTLELLKGSHSAALSYGAQYWCFCNTFNVSLGNNQRILSPATGSVALMESRIIEKKYGGIAPMFLNSNGLGGQLPLVTNRASHKYDKYTQDYLVKLNINPIVLDHTYGVMIVGQKTCQAGALTDRSYIGHEASFLNFIKEVRENVMIPQIAKHNNEYYRTLRKAQVDQYLARRTEGTDNIWADAICDTSTADGVNDVECQKARKFRILVKVKVTIFSEYVELYFENVDQGAEIA